MVDKVTAFKASDGSLHPDWYSAAAVSAQEMMLQLLPEGQTVSRDSIARQMAERFFVERNTEAIQAFASLQDLLSEEPQHENVVPIRAGETTQGGKFKLPKMLGGK